MIDADLGVFDRRIGADCATPTSVRAARVAVDEEADEIGDVLVGAGEPILQGEEISAEILRRAWDEAQNLRDAAKQRVKDDLQLGTSELLADALVPAVAERHVLAGTGAGGAVLGSPLTSLTWLANTVGTRGVVLEPGHVVLPGSITASVPVGPGDTVTAAFGGLGSVTARFTEETP